jgi:hypothetical protein
VPLNPILLIRSTWSYPVVFSNASLAGASFLLGCLSEHPDDPWRYFAFGLVPACVILAALLVALGYWSESGDSRPLRTLTLTAFAGGLFGLLPPFLFGVALLCTFVFGTHGLVG